MWTIIILILQARATPNNVVVDVRFTANGGPYDGASREKEFIYSHPTSVDEIVSDLTSYASLMKVSFDAPGELEGMTWEA